MQHLFVYFTAPDREEARRMAGIVVRERLAACANILDNALSLYWWEGEVREAPEAVCIFKTTAERYPELEKRLAGLHPYEVPCIVALPLAGGFAPFLRWIGAESAPDGER